MKFRKSGAAAALGAAVLAVGCAAVAAQQGNWPVGVGPDPRLPPPQKDGFIPTVNIAPAEGWPQGAKPTAPAGFRVTALATGLDHPRNVYALPNGDVLVAETNRPPPPEEGPKDKMAQGVRG